MSILFCLSCCAYLVLPVLSCLKLPCPISEASCFVLFWKLLTLLLFDQYSSAFSLGFAQFVHLVWHRWAHLDTRCPQGQGVEGYLGLRTFPCSALDLTESRWDLRYPPKKLRKSNSLWAYELSLSRHLCCWDKASHRWMMEHVLSGQDRVLNFIFKSRNSHYNPNKTWTLFPSLEDLRWDIHTRLVLNSTLV